MWLACGTITAAWMGREALAAAWREPVLKRPVLIVESDDWGAGPLEQAERLDAIAAVLGSHTDRDGRNPVMTLGLVLGVADGTRIVADELRQHYRRSLADPELAPVLEAVRRGAQRGVLAPQLHGGEHYWPRALLAAARRDPRVAEWMRSPGIPRTEALPAALQSRWIDASDLPSSALPTKDIEAAALAEVAEFQSLFGKVPAVAVPPTFIWSEAVETAWADAGVQFVVTPGRRYEARNANGEPCVKGSEIVDGERGAAGITYVVRDAYFEPARGHSAERALEALGTRTHVGRPTLLETHRANFLGDAPSVEAAVRELDRMLGLACARFPGVAFLSTEELALRMRRNDPSLVERRGGARLHVWLRRLSQVARLRKLAWLTGAIVPAMVLYAATCTWAAPRVSSV